MEEFAYDKRYRNTRYTGSLPPVIFLAGIAFLWIYSMTEDGDMIRFKWWMPVFSITLVIWAFYGFSRAIAVSKFRVRLIEDGIEAGGKRRYYGPKSTTLLSKPPWGNRQEPRFLLKTVANLRYLPR